MLAVLIITLVLIPVIFPPPASAIVILPALILIPIAKLVALIIGFLSVPSFLTGVFWSRMFKSPLFKTLAIISLVILVIGLVLFLVLPRFLPNHPLY